MISPVTVGLFLFIFALGYFIPGYFISRLLNSQLIFVSSFILSLLILFHIIFWSQVFSIPISVLSITLGLATICIITGYGYFRHRNHVHQVTFSRVKIFKDKGIAALFLGICFLVLAYRLHKAPLLGADTFFRWDFLAQKLLTLGHFSFYPPMTSQDYKVYFFTDGIPPLVSFSYYWLYSVFRRPVNQLTTLLVMIQFLTLTVLAYHTAKQMFSKLAGMMSIGILLSSPLFIWAVAIGQETGYTAISMGGVLFFMSTAKRQKDYKSMILAGCSAALGILSREYGWVFLVCGVLIAMWRGIQRDSILVFIIITLTIALPWYVRTWIISGNPFYSNPVGNLFSVNEIHAAILEAYTRVNGFGVNTYERISKLGSHILRNAGMSFFLGTIGSIVFLRKKGYLMVTAFLCFSVWVYSVKFTANNFISTRVLTPAIFLLSVSASGWLALLAKRSKKVRVTIGAVITLACAWSFLYVVLYPREPDDLPPGRWMHAALQSYSNTPSEIYLLDAVKKHVPATFPFRILSDNAYAHVVLSGIGVEVVPIWSPGVRFIFDNSLEPEAIRQRLRSTNIFAVLYYPYSINTQYLNQFKFYAHDRNNWNPVINQSRYVLYLLPGT